MAKKPEFRLKESYIRRKQDVRLGGYRQGDPDRVTLNAKNPTVEGEEYRIYVPEYLVEIKRPEISKPKNMLQAIKRAQSRPVTSKPVVPAPDLSAEVAPPAPEESEPVGEAEEIVAADDAPEAPKVKLPSVAKISRMNRKRLVEYAEAYGIEDEIVGTGENGYKVVSDYKNALIEYVEKHGDAGDDD